MFKDHFNLVAGLISLAFIIGALLALIFHGMKDETVIAILATGSVGLANNITGVKHTAQVQSQLPQLPQVSQLPQQPATLAAHVPETSQA